MYAYTDSVTSWYFTILYFQQHSLPFGTDDLDDLLIKYNNLSSVTNLTDILSRVIADTTWAVILALNHSVQLLAEEGWSLEESVTYNGVNQNISDIIMESLNQVKFSGLSVSWHKFLYQANCYPKYICVFIKGIVDFTNKDNSNQSNDSARILQIMSKIISCIQLIVLKLLFYIQVIYLVLLRYTK